MARKKAASKVAPGAVETKPDLQHTEIFVSPWAKRRLEAKEPVWIVDATEVRRNGHPEQYSMTIKSTVTEKHITLVWTNMIMQDLLEMWGLSELVRKEIADVMKEFMPERCPTCGRDVGNEIGQCPQCGTWLGGASYTCAACGAKVDRNDCPLDRCPQCGNGFDSVANEEEKAMPDVDGTGQIEP